MLNEDWKKYFYKWPRSSQLIYLNIFANVILHDKSFAINTCK